MNKIDFIENEDYFKNAIILNKHALDFEWERQAYLMYYYGDAACEASDELNKKQLQYNHKKASISKEYRQGLRKIENINRLTDAGVKEAVESDEELFELQKEINELKYQYEIAMNAVRALMQKKHAIEHEVQLYFAKYYSSPRQKIPGSIESTSDGISDDFFNKLKNNIKEQRE